MNTAIWDIPRVYTGLAEWLACMIYLWIYPPRLSRKWQLPAALVCLAVQCGFLVLTDDVPIVLWVPCMVAAFGLMVGQLLLLCDLRPKEACYIGVHAFVLAEFAAALQWQLHCFLWGAGHPVWWKCYALLILVFGAVYLLAWGLSRRLYPNGTVLSVSGGELTVVLIIGIIIFAVSNLSFYSKNNPFVSIYAQEIMNIRTLVDFAGNAVLVAYFVQCRQQQSLKELSAMQTILENQYAQYRLSRDTIELIDRKYHDLKHLFAALRAEPDAAVREKWLQEMEEEIRIYEIQNKTGHRVLDTVLTGKSLYCQKHGIELLVVADGKLLEFMDVMDICTIFGNALDNAIEYELKIPDKSRRLIRLMLSAQKQFLLLQLENYCPEPPKFRNGLPMTTKEDPANHGFGLKSIRAAAEKYGGSMTAGVEDDWFVLKMLIPLKQKA